MNLNAHIYCTTILLHAVTNLSAQLAEPARWYYQTSVKQVKIGGEVKLQFNLSLEDNWYVYSTDHDPEVGLLPTEITFEKHKSFELVGDPIPLKVQQKFDNVWMDDIRVIQENGGGFVQKIKVLDENLTVRGTLRYTLCSADTGMCIFMEEDFEFKKIVVKETEEM